ncbi:hypothetical protein M514_11530 [Trichuris suis]|uniref:Uncharacterized protein n=1 Tax=Trichuris suis TaxID=68888 RepID=A0A085NDU5_9BILA|nr:hypothetical protein M514_11530 [Trichuris suis]
MEPGPSKIDKQDCDTFSAFSCVQIEDTSAKPDKAGSNYDEDFGDFATAAPTCNAEGELTATNEAKSIATNWADFHTALYPSSSGSRDNSLNVNSLIDQFDRLVCASFPDVLSSGSEGPRILRQLETLAALLRENEAEVNGLQAHESTVAQKLWQSLRSVEEAMALQFKWNDSLLYSIYLTTLGMSMQLAQTTKCPYPAFAAQLSQVSLKPEKCADIVPISPVLAEPVSSNDSCFAGANSTAFLLNPPVNKDSSRTGFFTLQHRIISVDTSFHVASNEAANSFPLDIFSLSIDEAMSATKPTWQEDLEQLGLMEKSTNQKANFQPLSNGTIGAATKCVPKSTVNVLPVLPPPPAGMLVRHKLEPK